MYCIGLYYLIKFPIFKLFVIFHILDVHYIFFFRLVLLGGVWKCKKRATSDSLSLISQIGHHYNLHIICIKITLYIITFLALYFIYTGFTSSLPLWMILNAMIVLFYKVLFYFVDVETWRPPLFIVVCILDLYTIKIIP